MKCSLLTACACSIVAALTPFEINAQGRANETPAAEILAEKFGPLVQEGDEFEQALDSIRRGRADEIDNERLENATVRILSLDMAGRAQSEKVQIARAIRVAAAFEAETKGHTAELVELLETAALLDPDDENLQKEARFQRQRWDTAMQRIELANEKRASNGQKGER